MLRNASRSYIVVGASSTDTGMKRLPCKNVQVDRDPHLWDASMADDLGYGRQAKGIKTCTGSFDVLHRTVDAQNAVEEGGEYYAQLYSDGGAVPYQGTIIIGKCSTKADIMGELVTSCEFGFQGIFNSPSYPTAIADAAASTGRFASGFIPNYAPATGGADGVAATGGVTNGAATGTTGTSS